MSAYNQMVAARSEQLQMRIDMKLLRHAMYLLALDPPPTEAELALARIIVGAPGQHAGRFARIVAQEPSLAQKINDDVSGSGVTDADLESVIATHFLRLQT